MLTTELSYLAHVSLLTALMWIPYTLNLIAVRGLIAAVSYPADPKPLAPWAARMKKAHANAIENLVIFGMLVLVAHAADANNAVTAGACAVYFWARCLHLVAYTLAIPWVRTIAFVVGFGCQAAIAAQILM